MTNENRDIFGQLLQEIVTAADSGSALVLGPQAVKNLRAVITEILKLASAHEPKPNAAPGESSGPQNPAMPDGGTTISRELAGQWKPIESCPKDGNAFLCGWWSDRYSYWWVFKVHWANGIVECGNTGAREPMDVPATHWMPLPDPPPSAQRT